MQIDDLFPDQNRHLRNLLGLYLSKKRAELNLSVEQIALQALVTPTTYRKIEAGQIRVSNEIFDRIQDVLELDTEELVEIGQISSIFYINELSKALTQNYPE